MGKGVLRGKRSERREKEKQKRNSRSKNKREDLQVKTLPGFRTDGKPVPKAAPGLASPEAFPRQR